MANPWQCAGGYYFRDDGNVCVEREQIGRRVLLVRLVGRDLLTGKQLFHVRRLEAYDLAEEPAPLRKKHLGFRGGC